MNRLRRARPWLGTLVEISVAAEFDTPALLAAVEAAYAVIAEVHAAMSVHELDSELSRLNRSAHLEAVSVSAEVLAVLRAALAFAEDSDGAFDPVVGGRLTRLGLLPVTEVTAAPQANWRDVLIDGDRVRFRQPLRLDFGGIAKGYAVDLAIERLRAAGMTEAQVNAGGDLRVFGPAPQRIALRDPRAPSQWSQIVELDDQALATSAPYYAAGSSPSALIDPRSGSPYAGTDSISVIAPSCRVADALTKVALFATPARLEALLEQHDARLLIQRCAT